MGAQEAEYRARIGAAFAAVDAELKPPQSAEVAMQQFFSLMNAVMPVVEVMSRPVSSAEDDPDELGFYRRWREREQRRSRNA